MLINEASFEDLVNPHTEGAFTWRQLAWAAQRQGAVPPTADPPDQRLRDTASAPGHPMEILTLPEPAAGLWAARRRIVHAIPPEMFRSNIPPHLGGGTILAARWKHRISTDTDVLLPGRNTLIDLLQDNDRNIVNQLGGAPEAVAAGRVKIAFEHGFLDISTFRPDPPYGHAVATVDGQLERVLSSHQILCGKLERVD